MTKYKHQRLFTLNNPYSPRLCPELAKEIGLNESIVLLQLEFWLATQGEERDDGYLWLRKTIREIQQEFTYWGTGTIGRILESLIAKGFIVAAGLDDGPGRSGRWLRFNFEQLETLQSIRVLSHSGKTVFPNNGDSVPNGDNRPYMYKDQDTLAGAPLPPVTNVSKFVSKRSRPQSNGYTKKPTAPVKTFLEQGARPCDDAIKAARQACPDVDIDLTIPEWRNRRIADGREATDWNSDFVAYCITNQKRINESRARYANAN